MIKREINCGGCKFNAMRLKGFRRGFENGCRPEACALFELSTFENADLWPWFEGLVDMVESGLGDLAMLWLSELDSEMIHAFMAFRSALLGNLRKKEG